MELNIKATIPDRWVPQFVAMLAEMEQLGNIGSTKSLVFYSDGDGDFKPKFEFTDKRGNPIADVEDINAYPVPAKIIVGDWETTSGVLYDADNMEEY